jgi:hypothetical protein
MPPEPEMAHGVCDGASVDQKVFVRGNPNSPGAAVSKQFPIVLAGEEQKPLTHGSGRLELARWMTSPDHPLTARVMVNRIWQGHFGEALMRTPNNWGKTGETPTHPQLLDYLARRFIESGWSIKAIHRMILLSNAYQMDSETTEAIRSEDPANHLLSRFNRVRMSVEQIRDSLLALSGNLDSTIGGRLQNTSGPAVRGQRRPDPENNHRRTLYISVRRDSIPTILATFDFGDATTPGEGRPRTNVAPQALFMLNSRFVDESANGFAKRLFDDAGQADNGRIERAYLAVLTRRPEPAEIDSALSYIAGMEKKIDGPDAHVKAWQSFCHILLSTNEFLYLD